MNMSASCSATQTLSKRRWRMDTFEAGLRRRAVPRCVEADHMAAHVLGDERLDAAACQPSDVSDAP
jgi:hypothetical protein